MIKGKSLLGRSIVGQDDGKVVGSVKDLIFDHQSDEVVALVLANKDLFGLIDAIIVPWREVRNFSGDVVMVQSAQSVVKLHDDAQTHAVVNDPINRETVLSGTKVLSASGESLGTLADMCIDEASGKVLGYEVSNGFFADTLHGKKFVSAEPGVSIGRDAAIAQPVAEAQIKGEMPAPPEPAESPTSPETPLFTPDAATSSTRYQIAPEATAIKRPSERGLGTPFGE